MGAFERSACPERSEGYAESREARVVKARKNRHSDPEASGKAKRSPPARAISWVNQLDGEADIKAQRWLFRAVGEASAPPLRRRL